MQDALTSKDVWIAVINGCVGLVGAIIGAWFTLWQQSLKERIRRIDGKYLSVDYKAIKRDKEGYYIPGYGRILSGRGYVPVGVPQETKQKPWSIDDVAGVKELNRKVAFICQDSTAAASTVPQYVIVRVVPI